MKTYPFPGPAFYDTIFTGLVPCKLLRVKGRDATVRFTEDRGPYKKGATDTVWIHDIVPRGAVKATPLGQARITPYKWEGTPDGVHNPDHQLINLREGDNVPE